MNIYITTTFLGDTDTPNSFLGQAGKLAAVNATEDALEFIDLPPGGSSPISGTHSDFDTLKSTNALETGRLYWMTDYETVYDQPDYSDATTPKAVVVTKTAPVDPILLLATSPNTFAKEVWRPSTPKHKLEYDFDFIATEVMNAPAKGRITKCIDEFNNETQYDHSVVLFKRYRKASGYGAFNSFWDTGFESYEMTTFGTGSFNNKIGGIQFVGPFILGNNTFGVGSWSNTFGYDTKNNTFDDAAKNNTFSDFLQNNTFKFGTVNNTFRIAGLQSIDFTTATHIYQYYHCEIFKRPDGTVRLSYTDNTDTLVVVAPTA